MTSSCRDFCETKTHGLLSGWDPASFKYHEYYYMQQLRQRGNIDQTLNSLERTHTSPLQASYITTMWKYDFTCIIMELHSANKTFESFYIPTSAPILSLGWSMRYLMYFIEKQPVLYYTRTEQRAMCPMLSTANHQGPAYRWPTFFSQQTENHL